jgi:hypothetical protein
MTNHRTRRLLAVMLGATILMFTGINTVAAQTRMVTHKIVAPVALDECKAIWKLRPDLASQPCEMTTVATMPETAYVPTLAIPTPDGVQATWHYFSNGGVGTWGPYNLYYVHTTFGGHFDGTRIWADWVHTDETHSLYSLSITWSGVANNGGYAPSYAADFGANWKDSVGLAWFDFGSTHGHREAIGRSGQVVRIARW